MIIKLIVRYYLIVVPLAEGTSLLAISFSGDKWLSLDSFPANVVKKQNVKEQIMTAAFILDENGK